VGKYPGAPNGVCVCVCVLLFIVVVSLVNVVNAPFRQRGFVPGGQWIWNWRLSECDNSSQRFCPPRLSDLMLLINKEKQDLIHTRGFIPQGVRRKCPLESEGKSPGDRGQEKDLSPRLNGALSSSACLPLVFTIFDPKKRIMIFN